MKENSPVNLLLVESDPHWHQVVKRGLVASSAKLVLAYHDPSEFVGNLGDIAGRRIGLVLMAPYYNDGVYDGRAARDAMHSFEHWRLREGYQSIPFVQYGMGETIEGMAGKVLNKRDIVGINRLIEDFRSGLLIPPTPFRPTS